MIPERDRIKTVMTTAEIAAAMDSGDYSAEMLLQHLVRRYNALAWDASRVEWKYGRHSDGTPKGWTCWDNLRDSLAEYVRQPQELGGRNETE